jgi:hypothetical protein
MSMSADVSMAARPAPVKEISRQVEVVVGGRLRETTKGQGELTISLWNKTDNAIAGPIFVVIDETGLPDVQVGSHTDATANGKPVFELVAVDKELLPGGMTTSYPLAFSMPAGLSRDEANKLHLATRVFGRQGSPDARKLAREKAAREDADFATQGKNYTQAQLNAALDLQKQVTPTLADKPDVFATAITEDAKGNLALRVYTETRAAAKSLPASFGDLSVDVAPIPGGFKAGPSLTTVSSSGGTATSKATRESANSTGGKKGLQNAAPRGDTKNLGSSGAPSTVVDVDQQTRFDRPVPIGVSSFNGDSGICASGTLGCRVKDPSGKLYALSNSHVWGEQGFATIGQNIVQPSQGDNACLADTPANTIGTLAGFTDYQNANAASIFFKPGLPMNFIDAAIIEVGTSVDATGATVTAVGFATPSDGYGAPSSRILTLNRVGLQVQKYGRTTGYTRGFTSCINVAPIIGGPTPVDNTQFFRTDEYSGQAPYLSLGAPGDSGSLIVTLADRRPLSLLFAGGNNLTLGNQIGAVLGWFNVQVDDGSDASVHTDGLGNVGMLGRGGLAMGNLSPRDLNDLVLINGGLVINDLLPPELKGRVKGNRRPLIPVNNGTGNMPGVLP